MALVSHRALMALAAGCAASPPEDPRVAALEARVAALEAAQAEAAHGGPPAATVDPATGVLIEALPDDRVLGCVVQVSHQALEALYAHEARWEAFTDDITALGWAPESPCRWYVAARVVPFTPDGTKVEVEVVVTRGAHAGRRWVSDLAMEPREAPRWSADERAAAAVVGTWTAPAAP